MPNYDYQCPHGHVFESLEPASNVSIPCRSCQMERRPPAQANRVWVSFNGLNPRKAQSFKPIVIHRGPDGEIRYPGSDKAPPPPGFRREELTTSHAVRGFEREVEARETAKLREVQDAQDAHFDKVRTENRRDLKGAMAQFSPHGRKFAEYVMTENDRKRAERRVSRPKSTNFHVEALSMDRSNREGHCDQATGWKTVRD